MENWFFIFSPKAQTAPISCPNGTRRELHIPARTSRFHLSPGCSITLQRHKVSADLAIKLPSDFLLVQWSWEPLEVLNATAEELELSMAKLAQTGISRPHLNELQMVLSDVKNRSTWLGSNHSYLIDGLLFLLITIIVLFLGYRIYIWKYKTPRRHPETGSTANSHPHQYELQPLQASCSAPPPCYQPTQ